MIILKITIFIMIIGALYIWFRVSKIVPTVKGVSEKTVIDSRDVIKHSYNDFKIWEVYNVLSEHDCKKIIHLATIQGFYDSHVGVENRIDYNVRRSQLSWLFNKSDHVVANLSNTAASLSKYPIENQEPLQVAKYGPGGTFRRHFDPCMKGPNECYTTNRGAGHRVVSLLIYLNDDFEGGETYFSLIDLKIKPERGKGILFWSMIDDHDVHKESLHEGLPVRTRMKYICTKWSHPRKYPVDHQSN